MTSNFPALIEERTDTIQSAIPAGVPVSARRIITGALIAWNSTPALQQCDPGTLVACVVKAAQLGLDPSGSLGEAYLVPFQGKATLIVGYQGMIAIARRSGVVRTIRAHVVYEGDEFDYALGLRPTLEHRPARADRGKMIAAYAVAELVEGDQQFDVMFRSEIDAIRQRSRASGNGPWVTDYDEMARKTVTRRLFKYLPKSVQLMEALLHDNETAGLGPAVVIDAPAPTRSARDQVRARLVEPVAAEHEDPPRPARVAEVVVAAQEPAPAVARRQTLAETIAAPPAQAPVAAAETVASPEEQERRRLYAEIKVAATADPKGWQARTGRSTLMGVSRMGLDAMREVHGLTFTDEESERLPSAQEFADAEDVPGPQDDTDTEEPVGDDGSLPF